MTKIAFLTTSRATSPGIRFRVLPFVEIGTENGLDMSCHPVPDSPLKRLLFFARFPKADICVVQNKLLSSGEIRMLKRKCDMLVYDYDYAAWTMPNFDLAIPKKKRRAARLARRFADQCAKADLCIAANRLLADKGFRYQDNIAVIPTGIDTRRYADGRSHIRTEVPLVGWSGPSRYLDWLEDPIARLQLHVGSIQLSIVSDTQYTGDGKENVMWTAWAAEKEISRIQAMDIGLVPLQDCEYTRALCGYEALRYMACGAVPVATDVEGSAEIIEHGIDGFLVRNSEDWVTHVMRLAEDDDLRQSMAEAARKKVVNEFDVRGMADSLWRVLGV